MLNKKYYIVSFFACLTVIFGLVFPAQLTKAQTETTFPVEEAGIGAYVRLDSVTIADLTEALMVYQSGGEIREETYVIGTVEVENNKEWKNYPHLYIGLDGWMVAYYLKDEEASQIMQWKDYAPGVINTTTLKDAIDLMCENIEVTYSDFGEVKYYDFEFSDANKLTLIAETIPAESISNSFSLVIPGMLYEASYSIYTGGNYHYPNPSIGLWSSAYGDLSLLVDENLVFKTPVSYWTSYYGYYDPLVHLKAGVPHFVQIERHTCERCEYIEEGGGAATILIYQN